MRFFRTATGVERPYPYQDRFANADEPPELLDVPTGVGKTATAILGWLYRRRVHASEQIRRTTPRRLVYCLPMRTLVEQTESNARQWLTNLGLGDADRGGVGVHVLMGEGPKLLSGIATRNATPS